MVEVEAGGPTEDPMKGVAVDLGTVVAVSQDGFLVETE